MIVDRVTRAFGASIFLLTLQPPHLLGPAARDCRIGDGRIRRYEADMARLSIVQGVQRIVAGLAAFALLAQVMFAAPLAVRMLLQAPLCTSEAAPVSPDHAPSPVVPHDHGLCLLCHGATAPLAVLAAAILLPIPLVSVWRVQLADRGAARSGFGFWRYWSRAPPAFG
jgi:hypothetical protein